MTLEVRLLADRPRRLLVVAAHPDDADIAMAGSVAGWVREGSEAHLACLTSGDAGSDDASADPLAVARLREAEQRAAASLVGYDGVTFLHRPDGALANDLALREQLVRLMRTLRPDTVAALDPRVFLVRGVGVQHTDHRAAGAAALDAVYPAARNPMAFPHLVTAEGLQAHAVRRLCLYWTDDPSHAVDIAATLEVKLAALRQHASQHRRPDALEARVRDRARDAGAVLGLAAAEAFAVVDLEG